MAQDLTTLNETVRTLDGTESIRLATSGANWRATVAALVTFAAATLASPLTKTDDTNVTLTLGGSPSIALIAPASITVGWTGTLAVSRGGIGVGTLTSNGVLYGNSTGAVQATAQGGANTVLTANAGAPSFSASPTIGTSVTTPLVIGGTAASSTLTLESTSGTGTTDAIIFKTGSQVEAARFDTTGNFVMNGDAVAGGSGASSILILESTTGAGTSDAITMRTASQVERFRMTTLGASYYNKSGVSITSPIDAATLGVIGDSTFGGIVSLFSWNTSPHGVLGFLTTGNTSSPANHTALLQDRTIGCITYAGSDGVSTFGQAAFIQACVDQGNFSSTQYPSRVEIWTCPASSITPLRRLIINRGGSVIVGELVGAALATNATDGFLYIEGCAGTPTGTPTAYTGRVPLIVDTTNDVLYYFNSSWKYAVGGTAWTQTTPTPTAGTGTFTTVSSTLQVKIIGKVAFFCIEVNVTTVGTASGDILVTMPFTTQSGLGGIACAALDRSATTSFLAGEMAGNSSVLHIHVGTIQNHVYSCAACVPIQ